MTEPSQEAVELVSKPAVWHKEADDGFCIGCDEPAGKPHLSGCVILAALRAVEQRTRLETLNERLRDLRYYAEKIGNDIAALEIQRASLQPREAPKAVEPKR